MMLVIISRTIARSIGPHLLLMFPVCWDSLPTHTTITSLSGIVKGGTHPLGGVPPFARAASHNDVGVLSIYESLFKPGQHSLSRGSRHSSSVGSQVPIRIHRGRNILMSQAPLNIR